MARAGFSSSDYSNMLGDLYQSQVREDNIAAANAGLGGSPSMANAGASQQSKAQQAADDADTENLFLGGQLSDKEWMDYIATRLAASDSNPKDRTKWLKKQIHYTRLINDTNATNQFKLDNNHEAYIAYLKSSLGNLDPGSMEYKAVEVSIKEVSDNAVQSDIATRYNDYVTKIKRNEAGWDDLALYLSREVAKLPDGAMKQDWDAKLADAKGNAESLKWGDTLAKAKYQYENNGITAAAYAKTIRAAADYQKSMGNMSGDGGYWSLMTAATSYAKFGSAKSGGSGGGGGGSSSGGASGSTKKAIDLQVAANRATITRMDDLLQQAKDNPDSPTVTDSATGIAYPRDTIVQAIGEDVLATWDSIVALEKQKGTNAGTKAAATALVNKGKAVADMQKVNAITGVKAIEVLLQNGQQQVDLANSVGGQDFGAGSDVGYQIGKQLQDAIIHEYAFDKVQVNLDATGHPISTGTAHSGLPGYLTPGGTSGTGSIVERIKNGPYAETWALSEQLLDPALVAPTGSAPAPFFNQSASGQSKTMNNKSIEGLLTAVGNSREAEAAVAAGTAVVVAGPGGIDVVKLKTTIVTTPEGPVEMTTPEVDMTDSAFEGMGPQDRLVPWKTTYKGQTVNGWTVATPYVPEGAYVWTATRNFTYKDPATGKNVTVKAGFPIPSSARADTAAWKDAQTTGGMEQSTAPTNLLIVQVPEGEGADATVHRFFVDLVNGGQFDGGTIDQPLPPPVIRNGVDADGMTTVNDRGGIGTVFDHTGAQVPYIDTTGDPLATAAEAAATYSGSYTWIDSKGKQHVTNMPVYQEDGTVATDANGNLVPNLNLVNEFTAKTQRRQQNDASNYGRFSREDGDYGNFGSPPSTRNKDTGYIAPVPGDGAKAVYPGGDPHNPWAYAPQVPRPGQTATPTSTGIVGHVGKQLDDMSAMLGIRGITTGAGYAATQNALRRRQGQVGPPLPAPVLIKPASATSYSGPTVKLGSAGGFVAKTPKLTVPKPKLTAGGDIVGKVPVAPKIKTPKPKANATGLAIGNKKVAS